MSDTGYQLAKALEGTLWETTFDEIRYLIICDLLEI
jgi:hypothetical protein